MVSTNTIVHLVQDEQSNPLRPILAGGAFASRLEVAYYRTLTAAKQIPPDAQLVVLVALDREAVGELRFVEWFRGNRRGSILMVACDGCEDLVIRALRSGVSDYVRRKYFEEIRESIERHLLMSASDRIADEMVGEAPLMQQLKAAVLRAAPTESTVLITGETGTGKELVARMLHRHSSRADQALVSLNCAAIPETLLESELFGYASGAFTGAAHAVQGKLQQADGGTIFFDEIGDMNLMAQAKILRAIDTRVVQPLGSKKATPVDVRLIAATNQDLEGLIRQGRFRADLYYRLNVIRIHVPALRERRSDIARLLQYYAAKLRPGSPAQFDEAAWHRLQNYDWPGNVRELKHAVEASLVSPSVITVGDLPSAIRAASPSSGDDEAARLRAALAETNWNRSKAAAKLKWSRMTLYRKMAKYEVRPYAQARATAS